LLGAVAAVRMGPLPPWVVCRVWVLVLSCFLVLGVFGGDLVLFWFCSAPVLVWGLVLGGLVCGLSVGGWLCFRRGAAARA